MKGRGVKNKRRIVTLFILMIPLLVIFVSNMFSYWSTIYKNIKEKEKLNVDYNNILEEEENLKSEIEKLQNPEYVARYAREKYLFSKDGEIIIKLE